MPLSFPAELLTEVVHSGMLDVAFGRDTETTYEQGRIDKGDEIVTKVLPISRPVLMKLGPREGN